ncbi:MAG: TIGR02453 family protein [Pseudomonadota bacterium]
MADFPIQTCRFLTDLKANNTKDWFAANKDRYEKEWLQPAKDYVAALAAPMAALSPIHRAEPKVNGSVKRLHRDLRFSKDKTPFDPKLHMVFWTGRHPNKSPAIHIVLHPDGVGLGAGQFAFDAAELSRFRATLNQSQRARAELKDAIQALDGFGCGLTEATLKKPPAGTDLPEADLPLILRKGLVVKTMHQKHPIDAICDQSYMASFFKAAAGLNQWLASV